MGEYTATTTDRRVAELEAALAVATERVAALTKERDALRASHARLREELELLKRRIFVAKAERVDTAQLEIEFAEKLRRLDALAGTLEDVPSDEDDDDKTDKKKKPPKKLTGRRDLKKLALEEERVEILRPALRAARRGRKGQAHLLRRELQARLQARWPTATRHCTRQVPGHRERWRDRD